MTRMRHIITTDGYLFKLGNTSSIKGTVFVDYNKNGTKESGEPYFNNVTIKTEKQDYIRESIPSNGSFKIDVDTGTYKTSAAINNPYYTVVPATATSVLLNKVFCQALYLRILTNLNHINYQYRQK